MYPALLLTLFVVTVPASGIIDANFGGREWKKGDGGSSYGIARQKCREWGGEIIAPTNAVENRQLWDIQHAMLDDPSAWIGITEQAQEGQWIDETTKQVISYSNWANNEPGYGSKDNDGWEKDCGVLMRYSSRKWYAHNCDLGFYYFCWKGPPDVDECALGTHDCHQHATCANTAGSFTCTCNSGYTGTGQQCADVDECTANTDDCHSYATCTNTAGSYKCKCNDGYRGTGKQCYDHKVFSVECHELRVTGIWEKVIFQASTLDLYVGDPSCAHFKQNDTHLWVSTNFTDCGSIIREQGDLMFQQNSAYITASYITGLMQRQVRYKYNMGCVFDRKLNVSSVDGFSTGIDEGGEVNLTRTTNFRAELDLYSSPLFFTPMPRPMTFSSFQPMYVSVRETNNNPNLKLVVQQCFATATADINGPSYMFFGLKCPIDPTFETLSSTNDHFQFTLEAFTFLQITNEIHLHCSLYVCRVNSTDPDCQQQCTSLRKRRAITDESSDDVRERRDVTNEPPVGEMALVSETIYFQKKPTCKDMFCAANSHCLDLYPAVCRCDDGFIRDKVSGNCSLGNVVTIRDVKLDMDIPEMYKDAESSVFTRFAMDFEKGVNEVVEKNAMDRKKILGSRVISVSPPSDTLDISLLRDPSVSDVDTFRYFTKSVIVIMDSYPTNKNSPPTVYDVVDTNLQKKNGRTIVVIQTTATGVGITVIIPVVVVVGGLLVALCCLSLFVFRRRKRQNKKKTDIGMENKGVEVCE